MKLCVKLQKIKIIAATWRFTAPDRRCFSFPIYFTKCVWQLQDINYLGQWWGLYNSMSDKGFTDCHRHDEKGCTGRTKTQINCPYTTEYAETSVAADKRTVTLVLYLCLLIWHFD